MPERSSANSFSLYGITHIAAPSKPISMSKSLTVPSLSVDLFSVGSKAKPLDYKAISPFQILHTQRHTNITYEIRSMKALLV